MSSMADKMRKDGSLSFEAGQDAGRLPSDIGRNQVAAAVNTSMRGGHLQPRPGWVRRNWALPTAMKTGRFQHASFFDGSGQPMLLSSHGGRQFKVDLITNRVSEITPTVSCSTTITSNLVMPSQFTGPIGVASSYHLTPTHASGQTIADVTLTIGGMAFELVTVNSATVITVKNIQPVPVSLPSGSEVKWSYMDTNSENQRQGWSTQAENYWIYQDNQSYPIIFNGSVARRSNPALSEVPVGNVMAYSMGRLAVALPDRASFRVGDLVFGDTGTEANGFRDAMLRFTENTYLNEGGDFVARVFGAPSGYGPITAMRPLAMMDTQLGQGPLLVGTPYVVFTLNLPFDRNTWKDLANPLQTVTPVVGPVSQDSTVPINTDLWYRGIDKGVHSFVLARRDFTSYGNTPQSTELGETLNYDTPWLLEYASAVFFDNRLIGTCSPVPSTMGVWHRGLTVLDYHLISSLRNKLPPAWEGIWNGLRFFKLVQGVVNGKSRCWAYALNDLNETEIWELDPEATMDDNSTPITWAVVHPSYNFGDGFSLKKLETGEWFIDDLKGQVWITVKYRSDQNPCWQLWDSFCPCATVSDCEPFSTCRTSLISYREQFRSKIRLHQPLDTFDTINGRKYRTGYEFQPRTEITGHCRVKQLRLLAFDESELMVADRATTCPTQGVTTPTKAVLGNPEQNWAFGDPNTGQVFGWP